MTVTREELQAKVLLAQGELGLAEKALSEFDSAIEQNVFDTLEDAIEVLTERLLEQACADCEGSYNCGVEEYTQEFVVDGIHYMGTLTCEYNRHDRTYYYVEEHKFTYKLKG